LKLNECGDPRTSGGATAKIPKQNKKQTALLTPKEGEKQKVTQRSPWGKLPQGIFQKEEKNHGQKMAREEQPGRVDVRSKRGGLLRTTGWTHTSGHGHA